MAQTNTAAEMRPRITVIDPRKPETAKLRVAAYARVSSDSADQLNSYMAQVDFYTKFIASKKEWELVDIYADEGLSGLEARKREEFNRMIADCRDGKIDRVLVKSTSRFARNTTDYIRYVRELLRLGISICFEKENIDTGKMTTEQIAQIYGAFSQMESTNHSNNMRVSVRMRMEKGIFVPPTSPYGYRLAGRDLEIIPEEAEVVRYIYSAYLKGQGTADIAHELNELGAIRGHGREGWHPNTVQYILTNISYTGNMLWQKSFATDTIPFRQVLNRGQKPKYFAENCHLPIVSREDFQRVQNLMSLRREQFVGDAPTPEASVYSKHIVCGDCGSICRRKVTNSKTYWVCWNHDAAKSNCPVPQVPEEEITAALLRLYHKLKRDGGKILATVLEQLRELRERELRSNRKIRDIDKEIAHLSEQNLVLVRLKSKGYVDPALYLSQQGEIEQKLRTLRRLRRRILDSTSEDAQIQNTEIMLDCLEDGPRWLDGPSPELFESLVRRIVIVSADTLKFTLLNGLELTERIGKAVR
ncbi:recombinase family protein [Flintibacter muris]|uniref:recombinase family protein n=1 Tax=Flintibacter muris TaxID=2941327 RepID=UPI0020409092|nr:recombinase family protein [Flintibacter muris]